MKKFTVLFFIEWLVLSGAAYAEQSIDGVDVEVYRSPTCGCCGKWVQHLKDNNFNVKDVVLDDMVSVKERFGVPKELASCHTAIVDGYVVEGHVPAEDIRNLLKARPKIKGISVPGMPMGTPGMEMGGRKDPYQVIAFDEKNKLEIFNSHDQE